MAISAEFTADFSQYQSAAHETTAALVELQTTSTKIDVAQQTQAAGTAFKELAGEVVGFAQEFIGSFAEEEAATKRLEQALRNTGQASSEVIEAYGAMGAKFQETTTYADDAITAAQTVFTQIGHVGPEQMEPAIQAAADLAAGLGIGIEEAAGMMSKALGSGGESLGALKKVLGDNIEKGASFEDTMAAINKQFGGQAAAAMDTTTGKLTALSNKWDDLKGQIGELLANALTPVLDTFMSLDPTLQTVIVGAVGLAAALTPIAMAFGAVVTAIAPLVTLIGGAGGITALLTTLGATLAAIAAPVAIAVAAIGAVYLAFKYWDQIEAIAKSVYEGIKRWIVDGFAALLAPIQKTIEAVAGGFKWLYDKVVGHSYVPDLIDGVRSSFGELDSAMVKPAQGAASATIAAFAEVESAVSVAMAAQRAHAVNQMAIVDAYTKAGVFMNTSTLGIGSGGMAYALSAGRTGAYAPEYPVTVNVQGSVIAQGELAAAVEEAMMQAYRSGGSRVPV